LTKSHTKGITGQIVSLETKVVVVIRVHDKTVSKAKRVTAKAGGSLRRLVKDRSQMEVK